jgi:hypothetical protein
VTALLAIGLAGAATELARSPQLVSFTAPAQQSAAAVLPATLASQPWDPAGLTAPAGYQNVAFHSPNSPRARRADFAQPHMTLLKATMPAASGVQNWSDSQAARSAAYAPRAIARAKAPAARMIQTSAKTTPRPTGARHPATRRLAQSYVVMTSWTMAGSMTETMTESATTESATVERAYGQPGGSVGAARPGVTRMTVLVDRFSDRSPGGISQRMPAATPYQSQGQGVSAPRKQLQARRRAQAQQIFPLYAAVPTDLGWVIVEL